MWKSIATRIDVEQAPSLRLVAPHHTHPALPRGNSRRRNLAGWVTIAACLVLFAGVWADQRAERSRARERRPAQPPTREYRTEAGQRASVTLPDGSAFQLGPMSVLRVLGGYGSPDRVVELEGDGYFNVTHDEKHPFSVRTARTTIRDIGTRFVVRARPTERSVEVAVADGEVAIDRIASGRAASSEPSQPSGALMVTAGRAALIDEQGAARLLPRASVAARFAWTRGEFVFDHVLVPNVLAELGRWYGSSFVLADKSLDTVRLTTVLRGETMLEALVVLETALDVDARVEGDRVTLTRRTKPQR